MGRLLDAFKKAIERDGRSCYEIARTAGVSRSNISRLINGDYVSAHTLERIADALDIDFEPVARSHKR